MPKKRSKRSPASPKAAGKALAETQEPALFGTIGLVGLGLMGRGIAACLLAHGHTVIGLDRDSRKAQASIAHIQGALDELRRHRLLSSARLRSWRSRYRTTSSVRGLAPCAIVIESVREDLELKRSVFAAIEKSVSPGTIIASNTSSLPITELQRGRLQPERYLGMHWGEPAQIMRYLEMIPGEQTSAETMQRAERFGRSCGKEPAVLRRDIRGFLSNRMMYAMLREACYLVEAGIADVETIDQSFRNDMGWWSLLAGPFRWMDLTGIPAYATVMDGLLPELCNETRVPEMMRKMVAEDAGGIHNRRGFYPYTRSGARRWEEKWVEFTYDMRKLAEKYKDD